MSIQFQIIFGLFFLALVGAGLLIWFVLAWGGGFLAMLAPLAVGGLVFAVVVFLLGTAGRSKPE